MSHSNPVFDGFDDEAESTELYDALRVVAAATPGPDTKLTLSKYEDYREATEGRLPCPTYIRDHYGNWKDVLEDAGLHSGHVNWAIEPTHEEFLRALIAMAESDGDWDGKWPPSSKYEEYRPEWAPSIATVYGLEEFTSWRDAVADAMEKKRELEIAGELSRIDFSQSGRRD